MPKLSKKGRQLAALVRGGGVDDSGGIPLDDFRLPLERNFVIAVVAGGGDLERMIERCAAYARAVFDKMYAADLTVWEREVERLDALLARILAAIRVIERELAAEPLEIPAAAENGGANGPAETERKVWFWRWSLKDQLAALFSGSALVGILGASFLGAQATFADSGLPLFEREPLLSYCLAVLPVAAAVSFKFIGSVLFGEASKRSFRKWAAIAGAVAFALWIPAFSGLLEGVAGVFDPFAEPNHLLGWFFNTIHIVSEVLIGAGLYSQLDGILDRYSPSRKVPNPAREPLLAELARLDAEHAKVAKDHGEAEGIVLVLNGLLNEALAILEAELVKRTNVDRGDDLI